MEKVEVWYYIGSSGDGGHSMQWFLDRERAESYELEVFEAGEGLPPGEGSIVMVETYIGSNIYQKAERNRR